MAEQEQNRSEPASPFKLQEAKKRGSVAKSLELNSLLLLSGFVGVLFFAGWNMAQRQLMLDQAILAYAHRVSFEGSGLFHWFGSVTFSTLLTIAPFLLMLLIVGPVVNIMQTGPILSFFPLKPDWDRINPAAGIKRLFSFRLLFEGIKTIIKLTLFGLVLYFFVRDMIVPLLGYMHVNPKHYANLLLELSVSLIFKIILVLAVIALFDVAFTRWDFLNKMKMSRREQTEEVKRREGDPRVRSKIRELQKETLKRSKALRRLPEADVLITNPTHLAVAIKYEPASMLAPEVLAKGSGELAAKMRLIARRHGVPIVENKILAKKLFTAVDIENPIPESLYEPVAQILIRFLPVRSHSAAQRVA